MTKDELPILRAMLEMMAEFRITHMPWMGGLIVRPIPPEDAKPAGPPPKDDFERFSKLSIAEQEAELKGLGKR